MQTATVIPNIVTGTVWLEDYPILEDLAQLNDRIKQDNNCNKNYYNHYATWYGDVDYCYTGVRHKAQPLPAEFQAVARDLEEELEYPNGFFNSLQIILMYPDVWGAFQARRRFSRNNSNPLNIPKSGRTYGI